MSRESEIERLTAQRMDKLGDRAKIRSSSEVHPDDRARWSDRLSREISDIDANIRRLREAGRRW